MTNHGDYSAEARTAAQDKARAAGVFSDNAEEIVAALPEVPEGYVLVAVVNEELSFTGTHHVAKDDIVVRVPELEGTGWAMVFAPGSEVADVQRRTDEMASLALRRAEMITRIRTRRS
jgi:hypothetical protein